MAKRQAKKATTTWSGTKEEAARHLEGAGYRRAATAESKGAPGARVAIETWQCGTAFAAIMTQYLAGRETFSRILMEVAG